MVIKGKDWQQRGDRKSLEEKKNLDKLKKKQKQKRSRLIQGKIAEFARKELDKEEKNQIRNQIRMAKSITIGANVGKKMTIKKGSTLWQDAQVEKKIGKVKPSTSPSPKKESSMKYTKQTNEEEKQNIIGQIMVAENNDNIIKFPVIKDRPKILLISDVRDWAWWIKSEYIEKYLNDEFDISLTWVINTEKRDKGRQNIDKKKFDLYVTYGYSYVSRLGGIPEHKKVTGVTAHRPHGTIVGQMKKCKWVHANSMMLLNELKSWGVDDAFYVPNGVDEELFRPVTPIPKERDNIIVGHVGKKNTMKGQDQFIKPAIKLAEAKSYFNHKDYTNPIPFSEMYKEYQDMDVFIVSSTEDGTPNPALEAAACGRPIISNAIGNMPEFIKDGYNGFIVERKIEAYVEKIKWFRENRDKMIEMGNNARQTVLDGWTWKRQAENYRNMFRICLQKR